MLQTPNSKNSSALTTDLIMVHFLITNPNISESNRAGMLLDKADTDAWRILKCQSSPQPTTSTQFTNPSFLDSSAQHPSTFWLQICLDIAKGLQCLHTLGYYHRDLHMMNWLFFIGDTQNRPKAKLCGKIFPTTNSH
jgi:hypothetical protein